MARDDPSSLQLRPTGRNSLPYLRVAILLCPSFTLTPAASFVDALRLAADRLDNSGQIYFSWDFIAAGDGPVTASCGLTIAPTAKLENLDEYDCVVVCGGLLRALPGLRPDIYPALRKAYARGLPIIGLCTGTFVLAEAGLLDGRRCALQFDTLSEFSRRYPSALPVTDQTHVIDRNIITGPGSVVAVEIAMILISHYGTPDRARKALDYMLMKPKALHACTRSKRYQPALDRASRLTANAVAMMEFRIDTPCPIEELAAELNTTRLALTRAFTADFGMAPATFWRSIRLDQACAILRGTRRSITEIAYETGFSDTAHFCSAFRKHIGMTPQEYRRATPSEPQGRLVPMGAED